MLVHYILYSKIFYKTFNLSTFNKKPFKWYYDVIDMSMRMFKYLTSVEHWKPMQKISLINL